MRPRLALVLAACLAVPGSALGSTEAANLGQLTGSDDAGRALLTRAFEGPTHPVAGTVAVVVLDDDGPFVSELDVTATPAGEMVVGRSRSFAVGRDGDNAFLARDGTLLQLGVVADDADPVRAVLANYDVRHVGEAALETGQADGLDLVDRNGVRRERLWVDGVSGVVVRRETYGLDGRPRRLVAFTELTVVAATVTPRGMRGADQVADTGPVAELLEPSLATLGKTGWHVPGVLPGGLALTRGYALDNGGDQSSLHLVFSDGLYSISLYQQPGDLATEAVRGAVWTEHEGVQVWRWPGAQPERVVWTADGMTFTAIGDATSDVLLASLVDLPRAESLGVSTRLRRGVSRVGSWLNPFA